MRKHAVLSPSAAERWLACPGSVLLCENIPGSTSEYAEEGTCAHELGELKARYIILQELTSEEYHREHMRWRQRWHRFVGEEEALAEMEIHTDAYVALLQERLALHPNSVLMLEESLPTGLPDGGRGTSDAVIVSPVHVEIIDLKYGSGVRVSPIENPQLRLYALGALDEYGDIMGDTKTVRATVFQPRIGDGHAATEEMSAEDLREWRSRILPIAEAALQPGAEFGPSDEACRWCPASGQCPAQMSAVFDALDSGDMSDRSLLTPADVADAYSKLRMVRDWANAVEEVALHMGYSQGKALPGYKVVLSGGRRYVKDPEGAIQALVGEGYTKEEVTSTKILGIGDLEGLLGVGGFSKVLGKFVERTPGKPAIAHEDDDRPAINPATEAAKAFTPIEEDS